MGLRQEYQDKLEAISNSIDTMPGNIDGSIPGMTKPKLKRFFQRFDILLGRLDKQGAKHPQYLFYGGQSLTTYLSVIFDQSQSYMPSGATTFAANCMQNLVAAQDLLERAVGTDVDEVRKISATTASDLAVSVEQSDSMLAELRQAVAKASEATNQAEVERERLSNLLEEAQNSLSKIKDIRATAETLTNPDGRNRTSLEALARRVREIVSETESENKKSKALLSQVNKDAVNAAETKNSVSLLAKSITEIEADAKKVLGLSSQAGLAASYKSEADRLQRLSNYFTGGLYCVAIITLLVATCYVLPELNKALGGKDINFSKALSITLLRALTLAPLVYVIIFTNKRIGVLETLRMDYAEKAAASLSYSGYRDQMASDDDLLQKLKASLLSKFHEHPERLLQKNTTSTASQTDDKAAKSRVIPSSAANNQDPEPE